MDANTPNVSIIMNCLNSAQYLHEAIDSIYAQTFKNWEIIFWDNASIDRSPEIAKSYDGRLRYFRSKDTVPLGQARNMALKEARGDYIAFLDCDDRWMPTKLEKQIPLFDNNPSAGLVFSDAIDYYQSDGTSLTHFKSIGIKPPRGKIFSFLLSQYSISMPTAVLRAKALHEQAEWFDSSYEICTDYDLFLRIAYDWECDYSDEPLAIYRMHESTTGRLHKNIAKERYLTLEKFKNLHPDFESQYKHEIQQCSRIIAFQEGKSYWRDNEAVLARKIFKKYIYSPKFFCAFFASYFPYGKIMQVIDALRKKTRLSNMISFQL